MEPLPVNSPAPSVAVDPLPAETSANLVVARPQFSMSSPCTLPYPYHFPVHNLHSKLISALKNGEALRTGQRSELMEAIYQDVTKFTMQIYRPLLTVLIWCLFRYMTKCALNGKQWQRFEGLILAEHSQGLWTTSKMYFKAQK